MAAKQNYPRLVIDAGNSTVKFAVVTRPGAKLQSAGMVATEKLTVTRVRAICRQTCTRSAAASSVVPRITTILGTSCPSVSLIQTSSALNFRTDVDRRTVGADRLANMAEAVRRFGKNVIVADFGTAATFDVLDERVQTLREIRIADRLSRVESAIPNMESKLRDELVSKAVCAERLHSVAR